MARKDLTMEQMEFLDKCLKLLNRCERKHTFKAISKEDPKGGVL